MGTVPTLGSHKTDPIHGVDVEKVDLHQGLNFCVWYGPASRTTNINIMLSPLEMQISRGVFFLYLVFPMSNKFQHLTDI